MYQNCRMTRYLLEYPSAFTEDIPGIDDSIPIYDALASAYTRMTERILDGLMTGHCFANKEELVQLTKDAVKDEIDDPVVASFMIHEITDEIDHLNDVILTFSVVGIGNERSERIDHIEVSCLASQIALEISVERMYD